MNIKENLDFFSESIKGTNAKLIAVSKTKPVEMLQEAYDAGIRDFGENKVQELANKYEVLPKDIKWHMIGHLQRNKVKYIAPFVHLIHAIDTPQLLKEINKQALKNDRIINVLLQVHIADEESKFGFSEVDLLDLLNSESFDEYQNIKVIGLMGMATNTKDDEKVLSEFGTLKSIFDKIDKTVSKENIAMQELSMGMSGDYKLAIQKGSTMIRVGSAIFGERNYNK
ncbi:YggS family pyridoxal phosphate-dependent enzyme [Aureibacter tunicatorum]|uniref:Pyridoxal phosphate homeostasis protein n=1 Tax=Aureibacter tunicatorum TaxID=866807 RepID=A0AAE3XQE6_9BACT|nr:YggS family pyridoxal phosphate-dependent enzyme [Aureibacter tunicatorum]MDR6241217.1 hypothetical protein [Aureibacter tunicatorum]BDD03478.1 YggS family pyridoxal phosphate enzyme [Aureibacter tunicatorum]